jgi:hypothetical protein
MSGVDRQFGQSGKADPVGVANTANSVFNSSANINSERSPMRTIRHLMLILAMLAAGPAIADDVRRETVHFSAGTSGSTINAQLKGYQSVEYTLGVTAGQKLSVQLDSSNSSLYFNVVAPGADAALYNSSIDGNGTTITIPSSGNYAIQVYLMRNAARRGEAANYALTLYVE